VIATVSIIPAIVAPIGTTIIVAIIVSLVGATVVTVIISIAVPVVAALLLIDPDFLKTGVEAAVVIAVLVAVIVDHYEPTPALQLPVPTQVASAVVTAEDFDPDLAGPIAVIAVVAVAVAIPRLDPHMTANRSPAADPDVCADALGAGGASGKQRKEHCRTETEISSTHMTSKSRTGTT
jgi:hypothetical protein